MPDRVVLYVWPRGEKTSFHFLFRPRYAIRARTAPSTLYDYYNPDDRTILPPQLFHSSVRTVAHECVRHKRFFRSQSG